MQILRSALFLALVVACGACKPGQAPTQNAAPSAAAPARAPTAGVDLTGIDHAVQPGDDFDAYANGA
jgi:putative endopeptidase